MRKDVEKAVLSQPRSCAKTAIESSNKAPILIHRRAGDIWPTVMFVRVDIPLIEIVCMNGLGCQSSFLSTGMS
jgi:hypothetical protein